MLNRLASINIGPTDPSYLELNTLFIYNTTLIKIYLTFILQILGKYEANNYWLYL